MDLSIVILSFNTRILLDCCLDSVMSNIAGIEAEVFVVDSHSTDGSIELVHRKYPSVQLIVTTDFGGFAHANNLALRKAQGRYHLLLNSDTVLPPDALQKSIMFMEANPQIGMMGVKLVKTDGQLDLACRRGFPTPQNSFYKITGLSKLFPKSPRFASYNLTYLDADEISEVDSVCGAFAMVRREAVQQVGLLDERFYFYGEDLDWAYRFKKSGWKVFYYPEVQVLHYKGQSSKKQADRFIREFYDAMNIFFNKHYAAQSSLVMRGLVLLGICLSKRWAMLRNRVKFKLASLE